jgi:hypothetical protein
MESHSQSFSLCFADFPFPVHNFRHNAFGAEYRDQIALFQVIGRHQFNQYLAGRRSARLIKSLLKFLNQMRQKLEQSGFFGSDVFAFVYQLLSHRQQPIVFLFCFDEDWQ